ncbi:hypothetical protein MIR68_007366 [Amoeboaphelidium protococcarum]|nr:hypothetical protein MIR68_007366 [Amoeboaphelidium protococcarum]
MTGVDAFELARQQNISQLKNLPSSSFHSDPKVQARDEDGRTVLHWAISKNEVSFNIVEYILDVLRRDYGQEVVLKAVNAQDEDDWTPLHLATSHGNELITQLLLNAGAKVNALTQSMQSPLHFAVSKQHSGVIELLLKQEGVDLTLKDMNGQTVFHRLCAKGNLQIAKLLSEHIVQQATSSSNLNNDDQKCAASLKSLLLVKDKVGNTCLHFLAEENHIDSLLYFTRLFEQYHDKFITGHDYVKDILIQQKNMEGKSILDMISDKTALAYFQSQIHL